ncbi:MAG: prolyl oligopeptidase family serine peptidase [Deltaproteobacteria bacterium]|nr:prolyl oligopeptidase family serine peptidase [Deltaproteobacteria bacterium]
MIHRVVALVVVVSAVACASEKPVERPVEKAPEPPAAPLTTKSGAPLTKKIEASETHHGVVVADAYRWLEQPHESAPDVKAFIDAQNTLARANLDAIPGRDAIKQRLQEILGAATTSYGSVIEVQKQLFAMKTQPPKQQPFLVVMADANAPEAERVVVDPNVIDPTGHSSIEWFRVSPNGKLVACSMSVGGSETGDAHVFDVVTGKELEVVPGVNAGTAGGDVGWLPDSSGFYYSRYPRGDDRPAADKLFYVQLFLHKIGTPTTADTYEIGKDFLRISEVFVDVDASGLVLVSVQKGDGGEFAFHLRGKDGKWQRLANFEDRIVQMFFGPKSDLFAISRKDAPRGKLVHTTIAAFDLAKAKVIIPESKDTLVSDIWSDDVVTIHGGRIWAQFQLGGPSELRVFDLDGKPRPGPKLLPVSSVGGAVPLAGGDVLYANASFVEPNGWYRFASRAKEGGANATTKQKISSVSPVDLSGVTVVREMAKSRDGTEVPVNILLPKGVGPGSSIPFLITGYGGYGVNIEPGFQTTRSIVLDRGVGVAVVNLRGGGEFGDDWHKNGALTKKQNVFDDFIAATEHLVAHKHALASKVAITGGSNGGLLMGAVVTQRPELFAGVASFVGIYDMLRVELEPNGAFNVTEFGSVKDKDQFTALYAYSPFHHVKEGTAYPPILFLVGANDVRVAPWHSRKMIARLQEASSSSQPLLLTTSFGAGHGIGSSLDETIAQNTDAYAFILRALGVPLAK